MLGEMQWSHNSHGKLGLIVEQASINEVRYACSVYICTSVLMNYECMTPVFPFITIATKFLSKHSIKRVLDTEMNGYHCFNFTEKTFLRHEV
jgi:hypothetical protein